MPVTYRIDKANRIIRTRCIGEVTIEEVIEHFRELERDPEGVGLLDVLLDLTEQTSIPKTEYLHQITQEIWRIREKVQFGICAVAAGSDALFGMLRMFEVFAEKQFHEIRVFRTVREAAEWLAAHHPTASDPSNSVAG
jgi:hypothetical protein